MEARKAKFITGPIGRILVHKTVPMLLGMLALMSFNIVDAYFVGKLGTRELAAMGFTFPVVLIVISIGLGIGTGANSIISRTIGQGDHHKVKRLTTDALLLSVCLSVGVSIVGLMTIEPAFKMLGASEDIIPLIMQYMIIWYVGLLFVIIPMVGNHAIRATGDMLFPAIIMGISSGMNIILDPIFIFGYFGMPRMGLAGAAFATVMARSVTLVAAILILHFREHMLSFVLPKMKDVLQSWAEILYVGIPAMGVSLLVSLSLAIVTRMIAVFGPLAVAGFGVAYRIEAVCIHVYMALCSVLAPFAGQNWGAGHYDRVRYSLTLGFRFSWLLAGVSAIILAVFAVPIMRFFNTHPDVISAGKWYLWLVPVSYGAEGMIMMSSTIFNALRRPLVSIIMVSMRMVIVFVPLALALRAVMGIRGVFLAVALTNFFVGFGVYVWDRRFFSVVLQDEKR